MHSSTPSASCLWTSRLGAGRSRYSILLYAILIPMQHILLFPYCALTTDVSSHWNGLVQKWIDTRGPTIAAFHIHGLLCGCERHIYICEGNIPKTANNQLQPSTVFCIISTCTLRCRRLPVHHRSAYVDRTTGAAYTLCVRPARQRVDRFVCPLWPVVVAASAMPWPPMPHRNCSSASRHCSSLRIPHCTVHRIDRATPCTHGIHRARIGCVPCGERGRADVHEQ